MIMAVCGLVLVVCRVPFVMFWSSPHSSFTNCHAHTSELAHCLTRSLLKPATKFISKSCDLGKFIPVIRPTVKFHPNSQTWQTDGQNTRRWTLSHIIPILIRNQCIAVGLWSRWRTLLCVYIEATSCSSRVKFGIYEVSRRCYQFCQSWLWWGLSCSLSGRGLS